MFTDFAHNTVPGKQSRNNVVDKIVKGVIEGGDDAQHTQRAIFDPRTFVDHDPSGRSFLFAQHLFTVVNHPLNFFTGGQHFTCKKEWHNFFKKRTKKNSQAWYIDKTTHQKAGIGSDVAHVPNEAPSSVFPESRTARRTMSCWCSKINFNMIRRT